MKKKKKLIIGIVVVIALLAVAAWYFFFRTPTEKKIGNGTTEPEPEDETLPLDQPVCPPGTTGTWPICVQDVVNQDTIFANAIESAKQDVTNNNLLTSLQKSNVKSIIDVYVVQNKVTILADAATGKDLVQLILTDAERIYLSTYGSPVRLTILSRATGGKGKKKEFLLKKYKQHDYN